jgi:oligogalacturonide transporter
MKNLKAKLSYAAGDVYGGGAFLVFSLLYMNFLVLVEGIPVLATTAIIFAGKIWDAVTDPIMGRISDGTRSKFGRRRIYFLFGIIPVVLSFIMLFYSFGISGTVGRIIYHVFAYMFFCTAFTIVMVPYNAILSDITQDYNERTSFTTIRMMMSGAASLICAVLPGIIIKGVGGNVNGPSQTYGYLVMGVVLAVLFGLGWLFAFLGTKEKQDLPPVEKITLKDWASVFKNKPFRNFLGIFLSFQVAVDLVLALFIFYVDIVVLKYSSYELLMGVLLVTQILFMIMHGAIANKKGKAFPLFIGLPVWIVTCFIFLFLNTTTSIIWLILCALLISLGASAGNLSTWSMLTDVFDLDEIQTGKRREGVYSGITTFLRKAASGASIFILGIGLSAMGFDQNEYNLLKTTSETFDPAVYAQSGIVSGIKWLFVAVPAVLITITLIFALRNKINKKRYDSVVKGIESFKQSGNLNSLTDDEKLDIEISTGKKEEQLWNS